MQQVIRLHVSAPVKPPEHQPCNGCGVCCAIAPCPLGALVTGRLDGPCAALVWTQQESLYRCGLIAQPHAHLPPMLHRTAPLLARIARRCISAGSGCDCSVSLEAGSHAAPEPASTEPGATAERAEPGVRHLREVDVDRLDH